ncbi:hypothetical protein A9995_14810 [Erythrobacter sp. QSSC1-22B]|nr:hypothetical protein A9995_14810 [Erythrobacter sp. QSSC1-22B]
MFDRQHQLLALLGFSNPNLKDRGYVLGFPLENECIILDQLFMSNVEVGIEAVNDRRLLKRSRQNECDNLGLAGGVIEEFHRHARVFAERWIANDDNFTDAWERSFQKVGLDNIRALRVDVVSDASGGQEPEEGARARARLNKLSVSRTQIFADHPIAMNCDLFSSIELIKPPSGIY